MREPQPLFDALVRALIGISPLPFVIVENVEPDQPPVTYFRRATGDWTWSHPDGSKRTCLARVGSRKALELDSLLLTGNPEGNA